MRDIILSGGQVYAEHEIFFHSSVVMRAGKIVGIEDQKNRSGDIHKFPENFHIIPGFIDLHIHGAGGSDVMDGTPLALETISQSLASKGTTSFLATTMTASVSDIEKALVNVKNSMQRSQSLGAQIIGVHLEGPFLSPKKSGAQREDDFLSPNKNYIEHWQSISDHAIKLVTLAPELSGAREFIEFLVSQKIVASMGHTDATYEEACTAIDAGCSHATHLFNAMRGLHQREPGVIVAALLSDKVSAELIVDGIHVHPAMIELALKLKGKEKFVLVTDAMRAACLHDGMYELGGQSVEVKNNAARLSDGTLAGSTLTLSAAVKNMLAFTQCDLADVIRFASQNPAKTLKLFDRKGSISPGKDADIVVLNDKLDVVLTLVGGEVVYRDESEINL